MTPAQVKARFPEFGQVPDSTIQQTIDGAAWEFSARVWGTLLSEGMYYLVAHKLTMSPFGQQARLAAKSGQTTTYWQEYQRLMMIVSCGGGHIASGSPYKGYCP